jgi:hypothetical protein
LFLNFCPVPAGQYGQAASAPPGVCDPAALRDAVADVPATLTGFARPLGADLPGVAAHSFAAPSASSSRPRGVPPTSLSVLDAVSRPFVARLAAHAPGALRPRIARTAPTGLGPSQGTCCVADPGLSTEVPLLGFLRPSDDMGDRVRITRGTGPPARSVLEVSHLLDGLLPSRFAATRAAAVHGVHRLKTRSGGVPCRVAAAREVRCRRGHCIPSSEEHEMNDFATLTLWAPFLAASVVRGCGPGPGRLPSEAPAAATRRRPASPHVPSHA